jgi:hypothetical protein
LPKRAKKKRKQRKIAISARHINYPVIRVENAWKKLHQSKEKEKKKVVYFIRGSKPHTYPFRKYGPSRILYIGQTERNALRPFESLKRKAELLFEQDQHVTWLDVVYIAASGRQGLEVAGRLENACLDQFREMYGSLPVGNLRESREKTGDPEKDTKFFKLERIRKTLLQVGHPV